MFYTCTILSNGNAVAISCFMLSTFQSYLEFLKTLDFPLESKTQLWV